MTKELDEIFKRADAAIPALADYVAADADSWQDEQDILAISKSSSYAHGLAKLWSQLSTEEKRQFFSVVETAVAMQPTEPVTPETRDDVSTIWCTGFLEALSSYIDNGTLPLTEVLTYLGPSSLSYLNAWNEHHGLKPYA